MKYASLLLLLALSGCTMPSTTTVVVNSTVPVIQEVEKPQQELLTADELAAYQALPATMRAKLEGNDKAIKAYAVQNAEAIRVYNLYAKTHNTAAANWVNALGQQKGGGR